MVCLVAADRYSHLKHEIIPKLQEGKIVISDRYILSSLILQGMDGVNTSFIMAVNDKAILPDIQIALTADRNVIQTRLSERTKLTQFEQGRRTNEEIEFLNKGKTLLSQLDVEILDIENTGNLQENVTLIVKRILEENKNELSVI